MKTMIAAARWISLSIASPIFLKASLAITVKAIYAGAAVIINSHWGLMAGTSWGFTNAIGLHFPHLDLAGNGSRAVILNLAIERF